LSHVAPPATNGVCASSPRQLRGLGSRRRVRILLTICVTLVTIGRPLDYYATLPARLGALSRDDVARVSRTLLDPARLPATVVVGPKKDQAGLAELQLGSVVDRTAEARGLVPRTPAAAAPAAR